MKRRINVALKKNPDDKKLVVWRGSNRELFELARNKLKSKKLNVVFNLNGEELSDEKLCSILNNDTLLFSVDQTRMSDISNFRNRSNEDYINSDLDNQNSNDDASSVATMMSTAVSMVAFKPNDDPDYDGKWASSADELGGEVRELNRPERCSNLSVATSLVRFQQTNHSWHRSVKREISEHDIKIAIKHGFKVVEGNYFRYTTDKIVLIVTMVNNEPRVITCWRNFLEDQIEENLNFDTMTISDIDEGTDEYVRQISAYDQQRLIGPGGSIIRGIETKTGAKIHILRIGSFVVISGRSFETDAATVYINDIVDGNGDKAYLDILQMHTARVICPVNAIPLVIGKKGANIEYLKEKFGLTYCSYDNSTFVFTLMGSEGSVRVSARQIESISINGCFLGSNIINIPFPKRMVGKVIGKNGTTINRIRSMFTAIRMINWEEETNSFKVECTRTDSEYEQQMQWVESLITSIGKSGTEAIDDFFFDKFILTVSTKVKKRDTVIREFKSAESKAPQTALARRIAREKIRTMNEYNYTMSSEVFMNERNLIKGVVPDI